MQYKQIIFFCGVILVSANCFAKSLVPNDIGNAFKNGKPTIDFRLRYENAEQDPLLDAQATTLRSKIGFETAELCNALIYLEMVDVASFFGQRYNPGVPEIAKPQYSTINDPRGAGVTAAQLNLTGIPNTSIKLGRQYINLDNQRFIGMNDFRQYPQTFDAALISNWSLENLNLFYAYVGEQNTNFSNGRTPNSRHSLTTNLFHIDWNGYQYGNIAVYVYINKDRTITTNSNITMGFRVVGNEAKSVLPFDYTLEFARQHGKYGNPISYQAFYILGELGKTIDWFTATAGVETRSGSSIGPNRMFITPLGSNDNFNGLAQVFTTPPNQGLQDNYATLALRHSDLTVEICYHYFILNKGPGPKSAGQELDIYGALKLNEQLILSAAYAKYNAKNNVAPSTRRIWVMLTANFL
jgi:hypothetical protein